MASCLPGTWWWEGLLEHNYYSFLWSQRIKNWAGQGCGNSTTQSSRQQWFSLQPSKNVTLAKSLKVAATSLPSALGPALPHLGCSSEPVADLA